MLGEKSSIYFYVLYAQIDKDQDQFRQDQKAIGFQKSAYTTSVKAATSL